MDKIELLFDESRDLHRTIEKVITYGVDQEDRLGTEIREYIVTEHMEAEFEDLLTKMQIAMEEGGAHEVGVWVSGFYGSGKSSFSKYLGLALDDGHLVGGQPFLKHLQDRFKKVTTKQLLAKVNKSYPAAVVFLDLAADMLAGSTMEEVSTVLYYKVLEYAGYSRNLKVAHLERRLEKEGRYDEFKQLVKERADVEWQEIQNDPLVLDGLVPDIAHTLYPKLFSTPTSFSTEAADHVQFETDRVAEMLEIIRDRSGKDYVVFVLDEVGQYVASSSSLILNLQSLAENLKTIGNGKAWMFCTAQQMLTEDDEKAAINSPELFKLKDRFPIPVDLPATDIKEICHERLLKKSPKGTEELSALFDKRGASLKTHTKLENAKFYNSEFDSDTFVALYPFLPAHFEILLQLLGVLAKSTGGIGLRSAIKVIQEILIDENEGQVSVCQQSVGWLATLVTVFDALEKDIERAAKPVYSAYGKIEIQFPGSAIHANVGKTVVVLQLLNNIPVTRKNVAALMHSSVSADSNLEAVDAAIDELIAQPNVPFDERDGSLVFLSERLSEIQKIRSDIPPRSVETRRIFNTAIKNLFDPLPSKKHLDTLTVTTGIKCRDGQMDATLAGDRNPIQTIVELVGSAELSARLTEVENDSRDKSNRKNIYLLGQRSDDLDALVLEIYRAEEIERRFKNDPDEEVRGYCSSQRDTAASVALKLENKLRTLLTDGTFVFRADKTAVETLGSNLLDACKAFIGNNVADRVFDKYQEAPVRAETGLAESFLKTDNLSAISSKNDPLSLVQKEGGSFEINTAHPAIKSIRDFLTTQGNVDGKQLQSRFTEDPYGWSQDTIRYLVAGMFRASELKLKIAGKEITALGQQAIDGIRNNNAFRKIIVGLRENPPDMARLGTAAKRMVELTGEQTLPLEEEICKAANKYFAMIQSDYSSLATEMEHLGVAGSDEVKSTCGLISDLLQNDCSDAVNEIGAEESAIYHGLVRAGKVHRAFGQGLNATTRDLKSLLDEIETGLPESGIPSRLKSDTSEERSNLSASLASDDFYKHAAVYATGMTKLEEAVAQAVDDMHGEQKQTITSAKQTLQELSEWKEFTQDEQSKTLGELDSCLIKAERSLAGLKQLINNGYTISSSVASITAKVKEQGKARAKKRIEDKRRENEKEGKEKLQQTLKLKSRLTSMGELKDLEARFNRVREQAAEYSGFEISIELDDS